MMVDRGLKLEMLIRLEEKTHYAPEHLQALYLQVVMMVPVLQIKQNHGTELLGQKSES